MSSLLFLVSKDGVRLWCAGSYDNYELLLYLLDEVVGYSRIVRRYCFKLEGIMSTVETC